MDGTVARAAPNITHVNRVQRFTSTRVSYDHYIIGTTLFVAQDRRPDHSDNHGAYANPPEG